MQKPVGFFLLRLTASYKVRSKPFIKRLSWYLFPWFLLRRSLKSNHSTDSNSFLFLLSVNFVRSMIANNRSDLSLPNRLPHSQRLSRKRKRARFRFLIYWIVCLFKNVLYCDLFQNFSPVVLQTESILDLQSVTDII